MSRQSTRSPEPYAPRPIRSLGVVSRHGWRLKTYEIDADEDVADHRMWEAADVIVSAAAQSAGRATTESVGFVTLHRGGEAVWLLIDFWHGDIIEHVVHRAAFDMPSFFEPVGPGGPTICVWEEEVLHHERDAYVRHMMSNELPDIDGYLGDVLDTELPPTRALIPKVSGVPTFETERLLLRGFRGDDFETMVAFYADPISRYYGGPCNREDAWRKFAAYAGHWTLRGYGPWALESKVDGSFVGICGGWYPDGWIEPEITWALTPEHHGRGFATEAAERAITAAYEHFGWSTAVSVISTTNHASIAVADRLGATREAPVENRYGPAYIYRHRTPDTTPSRIPHTERTPR